MVAGARLQAAGPLKDAQMSQTNQTEFAGEEEGAGYASPSVDIAAALILIALAGWYSWEALGFRAPGGWHTAPGLVPIAAGVSLMGMALVLGLTAWRRLGQPAVPAAKSDDDGVPGDTARTLLLIGVLFVYLLAMGSFPFGLRGYVGGVYLVVGAFEITTILCLSAMMMLFWNGRLWVIATISITWTAFLSIVFRNIFQIALPG